MFLAVCYDEAKVNNMAAKAPPIMQSEKKRPISRINPQLNPRLLIVEREPLIADNPALTAPSTAKSKNVAMPTLTSIRRRNISYAR